MPGGLPVHFLAFQMYEAQPFAAGLFLPPRYICFCQPTTTIMRQSEFNPTQARDWRLFNLILETYGWDDFDDTEWRMDQGEICTPEGYRSRRNGYSILEVRYHAPVNMISLRVTDTSSQDNIQLHFLYDDRPERILEWIVAQQEHLDLDSYSSLLKNAQQQCEMILLEKSDMEIYEVKPSAS